VTALIHDGIEGLKLRNNITGMISVAADWSTRIGRMKADQLARAGAIRSFSGLPCYHLQPRGELQNGKHVWSD
jgi:hypothetical protein